MAIIVTDPKLEALIAGLNSAILANSQAQTQLAIAQTELSTTLNANSALINILLTEISPITASLSQMLAYQREIIDLFESVIEQLAPPQIGLDLTSTAVEGQTAPTDPGPGSH